MTKLESWRKVWREGFAPHLSTHALEVLLKALQEDDPTLVQGATTCPPPLQCVSDWPCEGACLIGYAGWKGEGFNEVGSVEDYFAKKCFEADQELHELAGCRFFLSWFDDTPREEMRRELIPEIQRTLGWQGGHHESQS